MTLAKIRILTLKIENSSFKWGTGVKKVENLTAKIQRLQPKYLSDKVYVISMFDIFKVWKRCVRRTSVIQHKIIEAHQRSSQKYVNFLKAVDFFSLWVNSSCYSHNN